MFAKPKTSCLLFRTKNAQNAMASFSQEVELEAGTPPYTFVLHAISDQKLDCSKGLGRSHGYCSLVPREERLW